MVGTEKAARGNRALVFGTARFQPRIKGEATTRQVHGRSEAKPAYQFLEGFCSRRAGAPAPAFDSKDQAGGHYQEQRGKQENLRGSGVHG